MPKFLRVTLIIYAIYLVLTLLVISPLLNFLPHGFMKDNYRWEMTTGWVLLNPFKLSLDISELELKDHNAERVFSFSKSTINLSLESIWRSGWVLDKVSIQNIFLGVTRKRADEYNFSVLVPQTKEQSKTAENGGIPGITIHEIDIHSDKIALTDLARATPYISQWESFHLRANQISTVFEEGKPYSINFVGDGGGTLSWEGQISLPQAKSSGQLTVKNLNLRKFWEFAEPWLAFELEQGFLSVNGDYDLDWSDTFSYQIKNGGFALSEIKILPNDIEKLPDTSLTFPALQLENINLNSLSQEVAIDILSIDELSIVSWIQGSTVSLIEMLVPSAATEVTAIQGQPVPVEQEPSAEWKLKLGKVLLNQAQVAVNSAFTVPAQLLIQPIDVSVENIAWPFEGETNISLMLSVNNASQLVVEGALEMATGKGVVKHNLQDLPLSILNPNLPAPLQASIENGALSIDGVTKVVDFAPVEVAIDGYINDFAMHVEADGGQVTGFKSIRFDGLNVDMQNNSLLLDNIAIGGLVGRVHIKQDGSINTSNIWQQEVSEELPSTSESADEELPKQASKQQTEETVNAKPWSFAVPTITIADSKIDFMDESLPLQFRTIIGDLQGEVLDLDSSEGSIARVNVNGSVDGYAPVSLSGSFSPFAEPLALDLNLKFYSMDMATLSPYSGTYAGYVINRGLLNLDLKYKLLNNKLDGNNALLIDKLQLGEKIESDKAVDLPLEFALAILTDANGVIDMQVPVTGDVNDPSFGLGSVIAGAFVNIITKVITSPFKLLAGLAGSDEDLERISFTAGSTELTEAARNNLTALANGLTQRPKLSLLVTGSYNAQTDREQLQQEALKTQLLESGLSDEQLKIRGPEWENAIATGYQSISPEQTDRPMSILEQYKALYSSITISEESLVALAQARAVAAKAYLVNNAGLSPNRAVLDQSTTANEANIFSGVELDIEN